MQSLKRIVTTITLLLIALPSLAGAAIEDYFVQTEWLDKNRSTVVILDARQPALYLLGILLIGLLQGLLRRESPQCQVLPHGTYRQLD